VAGRPGAAPGRGPRRHQPRPLRRRRGRGAVRRQHDLRHPAGRRRRRRPGHGLDAGRPAPQGDRPDPPAAHAGRLPRRRGASDVPLHDEPARLRPVRPGRLPAPRRRRHAVPGAGQRRLRPDVLRPGRPGDGARRHVGRPRSRRGPLQPAPARLADQGLPGPPAGLPRRALREPLPAGVEAGQRGPRVRARPGEPPAAGRRHRQRRRDRQLLRAARAPRRWLGLPGVPRGPAGAARRPRRARRRERSGGAPGLPGRERPHEGGGVRGGRLPPRGAVARPPPRRRARRRARRSARLESLPRSGRGTGPSAGDLLRRARRDSQGGGDGT
jgi:hypothetical protein